MSDSGNPFGFGKLVPGFDFLQNLVDSSMKGARAGGGQAPGLAGWIAPTLSIEDLDKRIGELKAVSFWLDQNGKALAATIQALEVQKMTLATLKGMNFAMGDVAQAFTIKPAGSGAAAQKNAGQGAGDSSAAKEAAKTYAKSFETKHESPPAERAAADANAAPVPEQGAATGGNGMVDPSQWWSALTSQFQQIANQAMQEAARNPALDATRNLTEGAIKAANDMTSSLSGKAASTKPPAANKTAARKSAKPAAKKKKKPAGSGD